MMMIVYILLLLLGCSVVVFPMGTLTLFYQLVPSIGPDSRTSYTSDKSASTPPITTTGALLVLRVAGTLFVAIGIIGIWS
jgi:hypothetical protein